MSRERASDPEGSKIPGLMMGLRPRRPWRLFEIRIRQSPIHLNALYRQIEDDLSLIIIRMIREFDAIYVPVIAVINGHRSLLAFLNHPQLITRSYIVVISGQLSGRRGHFDLISVFPV